VQGWGKALAGHVTVGLYDGLLGGGELPAGGVYVFSDLDRLTAGERAALAPIHARLTRTLNDPARSLLRYELLRELHVRGINRFNAYRTGEAPVRFPVFLRPDTGFLNDPPRLLNSVDAIPGDQIAVEFCDTADAGGVYPKYGAFVVGERIVPRHLFFSKDWLVKSPDIAGPAELEEELDYVRSNPHSEQLLAACRLARISWGRVDYALLEGKIQVWEINTNPMFSFPGPEAPEREPVHRIAAQGIVDALLSL
jgi:hypothetical protein